MKFFEVLINQCIVPITINERSTICKLKGNDGWVQIIDGKPKQSFKLNEIVFLMEEGDK